MKSLWYILLLLIVVSCQAPDSKSKSKKLKRPATFGLLNLSSIYSEAEQNVSFPIWFNDSVVRERNISEISRLVYDVSSLDTTENLMTLPKKRYTYQFQKDGTMKQMIVSNYYDNKIISTIKIVFSKFDFETGYAITKINDELEYDHKEFPFVRYTQLTNNHSLSVFQNTESESRLFIVSNPKLGKPLSIDTLCNPNPEDIIVIGSYRYPSKKYSVQNIVEELNVRTFNYEHENLISFNWKDAPFEVIRTFEYAKDGHCVGFKDNTNSMGAFVSAYNFQIEVKEGLPNQVIKSIQRDKSKFILLREDFEYLFFDK